MKIKFKLWAVSIFAASLFASATAGACDLNCQEQVTSFLKRLDIGWKRGIGVAKTLRNSANGSPYWETENLTLETRTDFDTWDNEVTMRVERRHDNTYGIEDLALSMDRNGNLLFSEWGLEPVPNFTITGARLAMEFTQWNHYTNLRYNHYYRFRFLEDRKLEYVHRIALVGGDVFYDETWVIRY